MDKPSNFSNDVASPTGNAVQRGVESAGAALHQSIDKIATPARQTVDSVSASAHQTVDLLADSAAQAAERFADKTRRITQAPGDFLDYTKTSIKGNPFEAIGIALALGFIVGRLTAR